MRVLFDYGNSRLKWALSEKGIQKSGLLDGYDLSTLQGVLDKELGKMESPEEAWISSVAGEQATNILKSWLRTQWSLEAYLIKADAEACGVINSYAQPDQLGSDRWAALVAVRNRYIQPATIVDCGTAVTVDLINDNRFYGGVIFPGLEMSRNSLTTNTAQLRINKPETVTSVAISTSTGIESGTLLGLTGAIEHVVKCQQRDTGLASKVYLTGGNANQVRPYLDLEVEVIEDLVLQGIDVIADLAV